VDPAAEVVLQRDGQERQGAGWTCGWEVDSCRGTLVEIVELFAVEIHEKGAPPFSYHIIFSVDRISLFILVGTD
jgi:hypothetical protein